jgi:NADP-dependent 3-hydroxy acid dehydrogenase YdfG
MPGIDESKCVLVTGATSGIGGALARAIANLPSRPRVIAAGRRDDRLQELAKENFATVQVDLDTDKDSLKKFVADLLQKYPDVCIPFILILLFHLCPS